ncbi:MAG: Dolichyl-phosphate-mannose-protein mannosyltransferase [Paenibacillus sp.]|nr:Dolichyl-phosphate-mannose-protein mannosyltransferase [Paenibacillus sp.]
MYRISLTGSRRELVYVIPLMLLSLLTSLSYFVIVLMSDAGFPTSDDSQWYLDYAHAMLADFHIGLGMNDIMYLGYNMLLTLLLAVFKSPTAVLFIQALATGFCVLFVYLISLRLFSRTTAVIASLIYCLSPDIHRWTVYILTDSLYMCLLLLCVYVLLVCLDKNERKAWIGFAVLAAYLVLFRPAGVITLAFLLLYIPIRLGWSKIASFLRTYRWLIGSLLALAVVGCIALLALHKLDPLLDSMEDNLLLVLYNIYAAGSIYDIPTPYDYTFEPDYTVDMRGGAIISFFVHNGEHILALYGRRAVSFLGWWVWKTDLHNAVSLAKLAVHAATVLAFLIGTAAIFMNKLFRRTSAALLIVLSVFVFCVVFFIDSMYRYKAPSLPFIAMIGAYGAEVAIRRGLAALRKWRGQAAAGK